MAASTSGQVNTNIGNGNYFWVRWSQSGNQDITNNRTTIYWEAGCELSHNYYSNAIRMSAVTINGTEVYEGGTYSNFYTGSHTIASGYLNITHNSDGKKTFIISAFTGWLYSNNNYSASATSYELPMIPRASSITATDANIGSDTTITINKAVSSFTHTITYSFSNLSGTIVTKTSNSVVGWTVPTTFYQKMPNSRTATCTLTCTTYNGNTSLGTTTKTFTVSVPTSGTNNSTPVIDTATAVDIKSSTLELTGDEHRIVKYKSKVQIDATGRCLNYSTLNTFRETGVNELETTTSTSDGTTTVNGQIIYNNFEKDYIRLTLVDSRNIPSEDKILNEQNGDFVIVPYVPLTGSFTATRLSSTSNSIKLNFSGNVYNGYYDEDEQEHNDLTVAWRYKEYGASEWIDDGSVGGYHYLTVNTDYEIIQNEDKFHSIGDVIIADRFNYKKQYIIQLSFVDSLSTVRIEQPVLIGEPVHDEGIDSNGNNYFNVNGEIYVKNLKISKHEVVTGTEFATNEYIDGEQVFRKRIDTGALPNATYKDVDTGLTSSEINVVRIQGSAKATTGVQSPLPFVSKSAANSIAVSLQSTGKIRLDTGVDRSNFTKSYIDIYYTKVST